MEILLNLYFGYVTQLQHFIKNQIERIINNCLLQKYNLDFYKFNLLNIYIIIVSSLNFLLLSI